MRPDLFALPSPHEIGMNPELALLHLLLEAIEMTIRSLYGAYPELEQTESLAWFSLTPATCVAQLLIKQLTLTADLLPEYRAALMSEWSQTVTKNNQNEPPF